MSRDCLARSRSPYQSLSIRYSRVNSPRTAASSTPLPSILPVRHDVQQRLQRRARRLHTAVLEVLQRHPRLRFHNRIHARGELHDVLLLRTQHLLREHRRRRFENRPRKRSTKIA